MYHKIIKKITSQDREYTSEDIEQAWQYIKYASQDREYTSHDRKQASQYIEYTSKDIK